MKILIACLLVVYIFLLYQHLSHPYSHYQDAVLAAIKNKKEVLFVNGDIEIVNAKGWIRDTFILGNNIVISGNDGYITDDQLMSSCGVNGWIDPKLLVNQKEKSLKEKVTILTKEKQ